MSNTILQSIYRYPFKGFRGHELESTELTIGQGIPDDRRYAITNGSNFDGEWMSSGNFFVNSRVDGLYTFDINFDGDRFILCNSSGMEIEFTHNNDESLAEANKQISEFMQTVGVIEDRPPPLIVKPSKPNGAVWDYVDTPISIINLETVKAIENKIGADLDPIRFRGNFMIDGLSAWEEFSWMGKRIQIGDTILDVHRPIDRCPAPGVNPKTSERDVDVTPGINEHFGHIYCGMYANVVEGGQVKKDASITVIGDNGIRPQDAFAGNLGAYQKAPKTATVTNSIVDKTTLLSFKAIGPWPFPEAKVGQKLRLHLGDRGWTSEYISKAESGEITLEVEDSTTNDPLTAYLQKGLAVGREVVVSGPYGRV